MATLGGISKILYSPQRVTTNGSGTGAEFTVKVNSELNQYEVKNTSSGEASEGTATFSGNGVVHGGRNSGPATFSGMGKFVPDISGNRGTITGTGNALVTFMNGQTLSILGSFEGKGTLVKGFFRGNINFTSPSLLGSLYTGNGSVEGSTTARESYVTGTGKGYKKKDLIYISGSLIGGDDPTNNLLITVTDVDKDGGVLNTLVSGACKTLFEDVSGTSSDKGSGAKFSIKKTSDTYTVEITSPGKDYSLNEIVTISGISLGGESPRHDFKFIITTIDDVGGIVSVSTSDDDIQILPNIAPSLSIISAVVVDSGVGYLSAPDGSTGGAGSVFSKPNQTIQFNDDVGYSVHNPNTTISVSKGDTLALPPDTMIEIYDLEGNVIQVIRGEGQMTPIEVKDFGTTTAPVYEPSEKTQDKPSYQDGSYPVVLYIKDIAILNPGVNYQPDDPIIINPDRGAVLKPIYGSFGKVERVEIEKGGIGFDEIPQIRIKSETGFNALIVPIFGVIRVGDLSEEQDIIPPGTRMVSVVDCVGRID